MEFARLFVKMKDSGNNNNNQNPIRTVYIAPIKPYIVHKIKGYFERFGDVESIRLHAKDDFQYGFVQFKTAETANKVLSRSPHRIGQCAVKAKPAHPWHQPVSTHLIPPPDPESDSNILNALNDDCLREVFKYLSLVDLAYAAEVCIRFNLHAKEAFALKHKTVVIRHNTKLTNQSALSVLFNFGSLIRSICVQSEVLAPDTTTLQIINQHTTSALKELDLNEFSIGENSKKLRPMFRKLEKLSLNNCVLESGSKGMLAACADLKVLRITGSEWAGKRINQTFPKLEEAHFMSNSSIDDKELSTFIMSNPTLKQLVIKDKCQINVVKHLDLIGKYLPNLVHLDFNVDFNDAHNFHTCARSLNQLNSLRVLKLCFKFQFVTPLMNYLAAGNAPIEHLALRFGEINGEAIKSIAQMKQMKVLELTEIDGLTDEHMIELAKQLPQLNELRLDGSAAHEVTTVGLKMMLPYAAKLSFLRLKMAQNVTIDVSDYKTMLKTIQSRQEKVQLKIEIIGTGDNVDIPVKMLSENRDWLHIDETIVETIDVSPRHILHILLGFGALQNILRDIADDESDDESDVESDVESDDESDDESNDFYEFVDLDDSDYAMEYDASHHDELD